MENNLYGFLQNLTGPLNKPSRIVALNLYDNMRTITVK